MHAAIQSVDYTGKVATNMGSNEHCLTPGFHRQPAAQIRGETTSIRYYLRIGHDSTKYTCPAQELVPLNVVEVVSLWTCAVCR